MRLGAALAALALAFSAGAQVVVFAQTTGMLTVTGGASTKWQAPVADVDAVTCSALELNQIRLDTGDGAIYYCDGDSWEPLGGGSGGAIALDDLTDVSTTGADAGEALVFGGATWAPTAAAVILEGDARLADARTPTAHADTHEDGGTDEIDLTGLAGLIATPQTPAPHVHAAGDVTSGTLAHERGGLEADVSAFGGLVRIAGGSTSAVSDLAGLNTALGSSIADGAHTVDTDDQVAAEVPFTPAAGIAATDVQAALEEVDAEHTVDTDTTCLDAGVACLFAASATEGGAATTATALATNGANCGTGEWAAGVDASGAAEGCTPDATLSGASAGGDLSGTYPNPSLAADTVGLDELAACLGPDEIVEYGASGVPSCIPTPSGGGGSGDVVGPASATDNAVPRYDGATGKLLQDSGLLIGDTGIISTASGAFHLQSSAAANRLYIDDFAARLYYTGTEVARLSFPNIELRSDLHVTWSSTTAPTGSKDAGLIRDGAAGRVRVSNGSTGTGSILYGAEIAAAAARACASSGDANPGTLIATVSGATYLEITNSDADGCSVTLSETGAVEGQRLEAILISNAGGTSDFADTSGVQETGAGCSLSLYGSALFRYTGDRWVAANCTTSN